MSNSNKNNSATNDVAQGLEAESRENTPTEIPTQHYATSWSFNNVNTNVHLVTYFNNIYSTIIGMSLGLQYLIEVAEILRGNLHLKMSARQQLYSGHWKSAN